MAKDVFSVPIFFIIFRETLEAAIIVSVLLALAEQIVLQSPASSRATTNDGTLTKVESSTNGLDVDGKTSSTLPSSYSNNTEGTQKRLIRKMRIQIFLGSAIGLFIAIAIGAAFIAVWFTTLNDLWGSAEEIWEGVFSLIASILIFLMGVTMLKMDRAKAKWRVKLTQAFHERAITSQLDSGAKFSKYALFILPLVTVLREGLEAIVFVGGVSLGQSATSIPLAAIVGLICGLTVGAVIYVFSHRISLSPFLVVSTAFLLLIGAGLFSKAVGDFERYSFNHAVGGDVAEAGNGPGSYRVQGNVWHLNCCSPENKTDSQGWSIFNAIFGWTNNADLGSILSYVFYWLAVIAVLVYMKWSEGRATFFGRVSAAGRKRQARRAERADAAVVDQHHQPLRKVPSEDEKEIHGSDKAPTPIDEEPKKLEV